MFFGDVFYLIYDNFGDCYVDFCVFGDLFL